MESHGACQPNGFSNAGNGFRHIDLCLWPLRRDSLAFGDSFVTCSLAGRNRAP